MSISKIIPFVLALGVVVSIPVGQTCLIIALVIAGVAVGMKFRIIDGPVIVLIGGALGVWIAFIIWGLIH